MQSRSKNPALKGWPDKASSDTSSLEQWAGQWRSCNWAVATGSGSGVFVLDVDGEMGEDALLHCRNQGCILPETLTVTTGCGKHFYFAWPENGTIRNSTGALGEGLDIRAEGGCAVIPPSIHPSGEVYSYLDPSIAIAKAPEWLLRLLESPRPAAMPESFSTAVTEGRRNATLTKLAGAMQRQNASPAAIEAALLAQNAQFAPPLAEQEARKIAISVSRYPAIQPSRPVLVCLSDVEAKPVDWLWEPYLPKGMLALLSGDPGGGKTFLSLAIAAALSNGRTPYTQQAHEPVNTLYLSLENSAEHVVRPRFDSLKGDCSRFQLLQGAIYGENQKTGTIALTDTDLLEQAIIEAKAGLLIVDPIQSYLGADVDAHRSNETRPVLDGLGQLAGKHDCCILLVRHCSKSSGGRAIHRGLGSIDITGAARTELMVGTAPNEPNSRAMVQVKNNLGFFGDSLGFTIGESGLAWTGKSDLTAADLLAPDCDSRRDIDRALDYLKTELAPGPKLQKHLVDQGEFTARTLQRASKKIHVKKSRDGERGPWRWSLTSPSPTMEHIPDNTENCRL